MASEGVVENARRPHDAATPTADGREARERAERSRGREVEEEATREEEEAMEEEAKEVEEEPTAARSVRRRAGTRSMAEEEKELEGSDES